MPPTRLAQSRRRLDGFQRFLLADNIFLGPQAGLNHSLAVLRAATIKRPVLPETLLVHGVNLSCDPDVDVRGQILSEPGTLFSLHLDPQKRPRWVSLVLDMGVVDLTAPQWLALVCASQSPKAVTFRIMLRSIIDGGHVDSFFRKTVAAYSEPTTHLDALDVTLDQTVPRGPTKRELILLFEPVAQNLHLLNFGVFVA